MNRERIIKRLISDFPSSGLNWIKKFGTFSNRPLIKIEPAAEKRNPEILSGHLPLANTLTHNLRRFTHKKVQFRNHATTVFYLSNKIKFLAQCLAQSRVLSVCGTEIICWRCLECCDSIGGDAQSSLKSPNRLAFGNTFMQDSNHLILCCCFLHLPMCMLSYIRCGQRIAQLG